MITETLTKRRELLGYSQQDVADRVEIDRSYYSKIESGLAPSVRVAQKIGETLGIDWTVFFNQNGAKTTQINREVI